MLKTKEQRAAEKALMDKSPMATLTLEDFLESERHKLSGTLTPVTPESFAKWKAERMDKKQAEDQARKAKDATGRALFESGNWRAVDDDDESDEEEDSGQTETAWNLEQMRRDTERLQLKREEERLANGWGVGQDDGDGNDGSNESADHSGAASIESSVNDEGHG